MGQEIPCVVHISEKRFQGKALLESNEIIFLGESRLRIPFASIKAITAANGELQVKTAEGVAVFELGAKAERWRDRILHPKSLLEKLGVKSGDSVTVHGPFDKSFQHSLKKHGAKISTAPDPPWVFFLAKTSRELAKVKSLARNFQGAAALWIVYPKGQKGITESDVRGAGLKAGLTDVKVASFSDTHTALKFVIPKSRR
jgi:hypothetical protein